MSKKPSLKLELDEIRDEKKENIEKKILEINNPNLTYNEKLIQVLNEEKTNIYDTNFLKKYHIKTKEIQEEWENEIQKRIKEIKDENLSDDDKRVIVLSELKTTEYVIEKNEEAEEVSKVEKNEKVYNKNKDDNINNSSLNKTAETSNLSLSKVDDLSLVDDINQSYLNLSNIFDKNFTENSNNSTLDNENKKEEKKFNSLKEAFYYEQKLFDILLNIKSQNVETVKNKYRIKEYYSFVYPNDLKTYYITESGYLLDHKIEYGLNNDIKINESRKNESLGLFFCGKKINEGIKEEKKCSPNEFICKDCMKLNKEIYYINKTNDYLININGRVAKMHKGKYHCFGHFLFDREIKDCINKFSCKACKMLDSIKDYYI